MIEAKAIENLRDDLELLLKDPERSLVHYLAREGFIKETLRGEVLNARSSLTPVEKGGKLVDAIIEAVSRQQSLFKKLVDWFKHGGPYYQPMSEKLMREFSRFGGYMIQQGGGNPPSYPQQPAGTFQPPGLHQACKCAETRRERERERDFCKVLFDVEGYTSRSQ